MNHHRLRNAGAAERSRRALSLACSPLRCEEASILSIDANRRRVTHVISTGRLDRGNRMVEPAGWKLHNFRRAPRVLANHDYEIESVIGRALDTKVQGDALVSTTEFDDAGLGAVAFRLVQKGMLNSWSVGWIGLQSHTIGEVDGCAACDAAKPKLGKHGYGRHFTEQELLEYSLVAIPANPDAVMGLEAAGLVSTAAAKEWYSVFGEPPPKRARGARFEFSGPPPKFSAAFRDEAERLARRWQRRVTALVFKEHGARAAHRYEEDHRRRIIE